MKSHTFIALLLLCSCSSSPEKSLDLPKGYHIVSSDTVEIPAKAQIMINAVLDSPNVNKNSKKRYLMEMYRQALSYDKFKLFDKATLIGIYLYKDSVDAVNNKKAFDMMLWKSELNSEPEISESIL